MTAVDRPSRCRPCDPPDGGCGGGAAGDIRELGWRASKQGDASATANTVAAGGPAVNAACEEPAARPSRPPRTSPYRYLGYGATATGLCSADLTPGGALILASVPSTLAARARSRSQRRRGGPLPATLPAPRRGPPDGDAHPAPFKTSAARTHVRARRRPIARPGDVLEDHCPRHPRERRCARIEERTRCLRPGMALPPQAHQPLRRQATHHARQDQELLFLRAGGIAHSGLGDIPPHLK